MINIYGVPGSAEYAAAETLRTLIQHEWPDVDEPNFGDIRLVPSAKCFGHRHQDIDLIVMGRLRKPASIRAKDGKDTPYKLLSFFLTFEIKSHRFGQVAFEGDKVFVRYRDGKPSDATEQSEGQKYSVLEFLKRNQISPLPHIRNFVWLTNIPKAQLPRSMNNVLGADISWRDLLLTYVQLEEGFLKSHNRTLIECIFPQNRPEIVLQAAELFTKRVETTPLNRKKVEMITEKILDGQRYSENLGKQFLAFRGRGGTGKTIRLLRIAHDLYVSRGAKILLLTYNVALVADIRRLLAIMQIPSEVDGASIQIRSIHSYLYQTLKELGLHVAPNIFLQNFAQLKEEALALGAIAPGDIEQWDFVLVDEAQDWPADERDLLFKIFGPMRVIVADGVDQLVRGARPLQWPEAVGNKPRQIVPLAKSLRLKANLCRFANELAGELGFLGWKLEVAEELHGGKLAVVVGPIEEMRPVIEREIASGRQFGNCPVDMLVCCPPSLAAARDPATDLFGDITPADPEEHEPSKLASTLVEWGYEVWDGASRDVRRTYPLNVQQLRLVQYDSCRGLEGWAVFCFCFDEFFDFKRRTFDSSKSLEDMLVSTDEAAERFAKGWLMIPMTRAMDTLIIHVTDGSHPIATAMRAVARRLPGVVDWYEAESELP